ncbi:uncharacterized protein E0L32_004645 [Thyridium curvatum]|uniref:Uncharacterized protein n=1 Tax=Thyridium curvatum TaxID=1093900 RepID=A0A507BF13_9PEZI|nr:uncharacterized protein E0L32_004645 [Thyridium curvatum]TPX15368.1 hypothetical protein E0L32_004645 [Thyridium curvatum]
MAFNNSFTSGADTILMFGSYYQTIAAMETDIAEHRKLLQPDEIAFVRGASLYDDSGIAGICQTRLNLGLDYYYAVKHQITSLQRAWDAILDEKRRYDAVGWPGRSRGFMESFHLCSYLIPQRVSIGFPGPHVDIPPLDTMNDNGQACQSRSYSCETSTIVASPAQWADHVIPSIEGDGGAQFSASDDAYSEALALSATVTEGSFEDLGRQDNEANVISISSGDDDDDRYSVYSPYFDQSEDSQVFQTPAETKDSVGSTAVFGTLGGYAPEDTTDALLETLLTNLPETPQPRPEMFQDAGSTSQRQPTRKGKPLSLELKGMPSTKRKFSAVRGNEHRQSHEIGYGGKRHRAL